MHKDSISEGPLFIIGMPRSGTKLLRGLLNKHPEIAIPDIETEFLPGLLKNYSAQHEFDRDEFGVLYNDVSKFPYFKYQSEHGNNITESEWFSACRNYKLSGVFEALIRCSTNTVGMNDVTWGDKSPSYICHIDLLKEVYPAAKFVHIVRDVRDYVLSMSKAWGKNKLRAAQRWTDSLDKVQEDIVKFPNDILVVKYEELLEDHEAVLRNILQFLGLPFDKRVLKLSVASENLGDAKGVIGIVSGNKGKYMSFFTSREILNIERLAGKTMVNYNYPVSYNGSSVRLTYTMEKYYQLLDAISLIMFERKKRGLFGSIIFYWNYFRATRGI